MRKYLNTKVLILVIMLPLKHMYAVTSGPTQPEVQQFSPVGATDMVDMFSGNFSYNIPLFELPGPNGGYPFNINYKSGVTMDQEASWIGLGWNLNVGAINRQMRCLPDEFNGTDFIMKKSDQLDNKTIGMGLNFDMEISGASWDEIASISPSYGISMYYNTYKGFGFATDVGVGVTFGPKSPMNAGIGISVKNDNQEGATFSPNLSLAFSSSINRTSVGGSLNLGLNYNSNIGLQNISLGAGMSASNSNISRSPKIPPKNGSKSRINDLTGGANISGSASMSFNNSFITSPAIKNPTKTSTFQGFFKLGGVAWGFQMSGAISGNYSNETLLNRMRPIYNPAYGYLHLQKGQNDEDAALDFIRENEGQLHKDTRNLPAPVLTYDLYSVTGHGFSGMFRPYRSDIGGINDKVAESKSDGTNVSFDASIGNLFQMGFSLNFPNTQSKSGKWKGVSGNIHERYNFTEFQDNSLSEPYRFQVYGERNVYDKSQLTQLIGGFEPTYVDISSKTGTDKIDYTTVGRLGNVNGSPVSISANKFTDRAPRQTVVKQIENKYLYDGALPECNAYYLDIESGELDTLNRSEQQQLHKPHHIGAFIVTTADGTRYIYALPVYNLIQVENSFSVKTYAGKDLINKVPVNDFTVQNGEVTHNKTGGDTYGYENYDKTVTPAYVHSWLLTAILGPDYIDINEDGVTDDDLGYFVKFTYKKAAETYKWRAPFTTANFIEGMHALDADNMGTYNYGERETYYLYKAETKSHKAQFYTTDVRYDARGAYDEFQISQQFGAKSYKLDSVSLFSKMDDVKPIKSVYFQYNKYNVGSNRFWVDNNHNELCQQVENATDGRGKLTLKAVYTTWGDNEKGLNNPYVFDYKEDEPAHNPNYNPYSYDRWGVYQQYPEDGDMLPIKHFPYTRQDAGVTLQQKNQMAAVWNLKTIQLPSGAQIKIDYEADRYAYVQNRPAMEMYKMQGVNTSLSNSGQKFFPLKASNEPADNANYVTFALKRPISMALSPEEQQKELSKYLDKNGQLYYKLYIDLNNDNQWEFITGYADIHSIELLNSTTGKIRLKSINLTKGKNPYRGEHPFALASWNFVQANRPELMNDNAKGPLEPRGRTGKEVMDIIGTFMSAFNPLSGLTKFKNFYTHAGNAGWGQRIDYDKSYIRLNSYLSAIENTVIEKFGGDSRVKSIKIFENETSSDPVAGMEYVYTDTIPESGGQLISTGVAANEPSIGGDENALKYGKIGFLEPRFKTSYLQFSEMPVNESYMPAPDVGYSKVTVQSYATKQVLDKELSANIPTTGQSVHEYYTAKDFPTITEETVLGQANGTLKYKQPKLAFRPLGGTITESNLAATQGYYTEINDMHGKEKKISYYAISHKGNIIPTPVSYQEYIYKSAEVYDKNGWHKVLLNEVPVIYNHLGQTQQKILGVDVENFIDTRQSESYSVSEGGRYNMSVFLVVIGFFIVPIPLPTYFPDLGYDQRRSYTSVDNKIVHRFGILEKTKVYKEGALTVSDNLVYDGYTGTPVLTSVNNEFNDTIYNYTIPAHFIYQGMGPAYITDNFVANGQVAEMDTIKQQLAVSVSQLSGVRNQIQEGDELLVSSEYDNTGSEDVSEKVYERCYVMRVDNDRKILWLQSPDGLLPGLSGDVSMYVYRPYNRNILSGTAGTVVSKHHPLRDKTSFECK